MPATRLMPSEESSDLIGLTRDIAGTPLPASGRKLPWYV